jgi:CheY-like chemotaxis protein
MHAGGKKTILLAEDHDDLRALLRGLLEEYGCTVLEAADGRAALEAAAGAGPVDLLVTDVCMPRVSGTELARRLLALRPDLKILFMSTGALSDEDMAAAAPAARFMPKPFSPHELRKAVREMLGDRPAT